MSSLVAIVLISYLLGSVSTSILVGKLHGGIDIRRHGSGNAGASNVLRVLGWKPGLLVLLVDVGKGFVAAWLVARLRLGTIPWDPETVQLVAGSSAIIGHIWPVLAGFRGGKGVGTAAGVVLAVYPLAFVLCAPIFAGILAAFRIVSVASMATAALLPVMLLLLQSLTQTVSDALLVFAVVVAALVLFTHRSNIARLRSGTELTFGRPRKPGRG